MRKYEKARERASSRGLVVGESRPVPPRRPARLGRRPRRGGSGGGERTSGAGLRAHAPPLSDPPKGLHRDLLGAFEADGCRFFHDILTKSDFLGNLQPSKTTIQKTRGALAVELADRARRQLSSDGSNVSGGGTRAEL